MRELRHLAVTAALPIWLAACGSLEIPFKGGPSGQPAATGPAAPAAPTGVLAPGPKPTPVVQEPERVAATTAIVKPGDTVYALSRRHRVSTRALIEANGLKPPFIVKPGQRITVPGGQIHRVVAGDTLIGISDRYGLAPLALARANGLTPPYVIKLGEPLLIPDRAAPAAPAVRQSRSLQSKPKSQITFAHAKLPPVGSRVGNSGDSTAGPTTTNAAARPLARPSVRAPERRAALPPAKPSKGGFIWPVRGDLLSGFGSKAGGLRNDGVNIAARPGTPVLAARGGTVAYVGNELRGFGNLVLIKHPGGWVTAYAHNDRLLVTRGQKVSLGQKIATVGQTGGVATPQLHFELRKGRTPVDPRSHLPAFTAEG